MTDSFARVRERMVQERVIARGVRDARVIAAMNKIPRHLFVEDGFRYRCYDSDSLPIGMEQTISQPYIVAYMSEQLRLGPEHKVLEVGTGSGYQTAVLAELAGEVFTIERHAGLQQKARRVLTRLGYVNVHYRTGDGSAGWPEDMEFDRVILTAAGPEVPPRLIEQLAEGGRLVMPVRDGARQELMLGIKIDNRLRRRRLSGCEFVPLVESRGK